jgi:4-hydroxybenzoate polyprenyltransferase
MEKFSELIIIGVILLLVYIEVLAMVFADLRSGTRKALERGENLTSAGYRKTITKIGNYFGTLLVMFFIDAVQIGVIFLIDHCYGKNIIEAPWFTLLAAIFITYIEGKSILEKSGDKVKKQASEIAEVVASVVSHPSAGEIAKAVAEQLKQKSDESK